MQAVRTTTDPRVRALADRMDALVAQMRRERAQTGTIAETTASAFRACDSAYWRVMETPEVDPVGAEADQVTAALAGNLDLDLAHDTLPLPC